MYSSCSSNGRSKYTMQSLISQSYNRSAHSDVCRQRIRAASNGDNKIVAGGQHDAVNDVTSVHMLMLGISLYKHDDVCCQRQYRCDRRTVANTCNRVSKLIGPGPDTRKSGSARTIRMVQNTDISSKSRTHQIADHRPTRTVPSNATHAA